MGNYFSNLAFVSSFHGPLSPSPAVAIAKTKSCDLRLSLRNEAAAEDGMSRPKSIHLVYGARATGMAPVSQRHRPYFGQTIRKSTISVLWLYLCSGPGAIRLLR